MGILSPLLGAALPTILEIVGRFVPDPEQKAKMQLEVMRLQQEGAFKELEAQVQQDIAQMEVNKVEAASENTFKSGWRPAVGWICAFVIVTEMIFRPYLPWLMEVFGFYVPPVPSIDSEMFWALVTGLLGLSGMRSFDKQSRK